MGATITVVIPGRAEGANPESKRAPCVHLDSGSRAISAFTRVFDALRRVPRNDG